MTPKIPIDSHADQQLGASYAKILHATKASRLQLRQAMLLDLLGADRSLWPALRHLIEQPGFEAVLVDPSPASRLARREAWLQDLATWCNQGSLTRMTFFLDGFLGLTSISPAVSSSTPGSHGAAAPQAQSSAQDWRPSEASHRGQTNNNVGGPGTPGIIGSSDAAEATSLIMKGLEATTVGNHRQAIQLFSQALQNDTSNAQIYLNRASSHAILGDLGAALADFNAVLRLQPNNAEALAHRGKLSAMKGDTSAALMDWSAAADQGHTLANSWLCTHLSEQGLEASRSGEHQQAIAYFSLALKRESHRQELFLNRACSHAALGSLGAAIEDYNAVLRLEPRNAEALAQRGRARAAMGLTEEAKRDWSQAVAQGHPDAEGWLQKQLQQDQQEEQQHKASREPNDQTTTTSYAPNNSSQNRRQAANPSSRMHQQPVDPGGPSPSASGNTNRQVQVRRLRDQALACRDHGDPQQAIDLLSQALQLDSSDAETYRLRALLLSRAGDLQQALHDLSAVLRLNPGEGEALALRGKIHEGLGHMELARQDWQSAVARGNRDATGWLADDCIRRAIAEMHANNPVQAIALCRQSMDLGITSSQVYFLKGKAHLRLGELNRAIADLSQAITLQPDHAEALAQRGYAYKESGRFADAEADWERARALGHDTTPTPAKPAESRLSQTSIGSFIGMTVATCACFGLGWLTYQAAVKLGLPIWTARALLMITIGSLALIANNKKWLDE